MHDAVPATKKPLRDMQTMAVVGIGFGAHDAHALRARRKGLGSLEERRGLHVLRIRHLSVSAERRPLPVVADPRLRERRGQTVPGKLRMAPRRRESANVDQRFDRRFAEDSNELGGAARPVAYREKNAQAALACFFSSGFFFFSSGLCSGSPSGRSISVTSAMGALSPLRKPAFRMRR